MTHKEQRHAVRERAHRRCEYCHLPDVLPQTLRFHLEHIKARRHGGGSTMDNLSWACQRCNERKGPNIAGADPDTSVLVPLFHPRLDKWDEHFKWEGLNIVGRTPTGRATVWLLEFNSDERLQWRAALQRYGLL